MNEVNKKIRHRFLILSIVPILILTFIKQFPFCLKDIEEDSRFDFFKNNLYITIILVFCILFILYSIFCYFALLSYKEDGTDIPDVKVSSYKLDEEKNINFLFSFVAPLIIDEFKTLNIVLFFISYLIIFYLLLRRTTVFYHNPVLSFLGYKTYELKINDENKNYICISKDEVKNNSLIDMKKIIDDVYLIKVK